MPRPRRRTLRRPETSPPPTEVPRPVAVVDMGASAIRLAVAEARPGEPARILEEASRGVLLGKDTFTHGRLGAPSIEATLKAMSEVAGPVVGITVVLVVVFVPMAFIPGITGLLYQQFALTIAVSVVISAFNALTFAPALSALILRPKTSRRGLGARLGAAFNTWFGRVTEGYVRGSGALIRKVALALGLLVATAVGAGVIGSRIPTGFVPDPPPYW